MLRQKKPRIGITGNFDQGSSKYCVDQRYVEAVQDAGGIPIILPIYANASRFIRSIDGLLVTGGGSGSLTGKQRKSKILPNLEEQNSRRYHFERYMIIASRKAKLPILGICRGHQMIAEVFGGTVGRDNLDFAGTGVEHRQKREEEAPAHRIHVMKGSKLSGMLKRKDTSVNSLHRQAVTSLPKGFRMSAVADDGVIEGIESCDGMVIGIQFHPEMLMEKDHVFKRIFSCFVDCCRQKRGWLS
ncbi:gamma-glutamyl-gamma-aminobutyrate hydrolase family protein [Candidatus Woesearchaeota archaeon]|nr:gamma-glutamyl-gamma-aminobutyrate hydrolase family protein [Candidatus Woesearchaeota archaeon]